VIHWLSAAHALEREINLYDRLFREPHPEREPPVPRRHQPERQDRGDGYLEPSLADAKPTSDSSSSGTGISSRQIRRAVRHALQPHGDPADSRTPTKG
jgi:hypothetical protein